MFNFHAANMTTIFSSTSNLNEFEKDLTGEISVRLGLAFNLREFLLFYNLLKRKLLEDPISASGNE